MGITYKGTDGEWHLTDPQYKPEDNEWHYIKNVYERREDGWHPVWEYWWEPGPWGQCSALCGGGTQTRTVRCVRNDSLDRPDIFCKGVEKPSLQQECNGTDCASFVVTMHADNWGDLWLSNENWEMLQYLGAAGDFYGGGGTAIQIVPNPGDEYVYLIARIYNADKPGKRNPMGSLLYARGDYWTKLCPEFMGVDHYQNCFSTGRKHEYWINHPCWVGAPGRCTPPHGVPVHVRLRWKVTEVT